MALRMELELNILTSCMGMETRCSQIGACHSNQMCGLHLLPCICHHEPLSTHYRDVDHLFQTGRQTR